MANKSPYLSTVRMARAAVVRWVATILGGLLTAFFAVGLYLVFTDLSLREDWLMVIVLFLLSAALLWRGIAAGREATLAKRYALYFSFDRDGHYSLRELKKSTGKDEAQIRAELERLFRRGYFTGCALEHEPLAVVLSGAEKPEARFVTVVCPNCGGTSRLRAKSSGVCEYCGSAIKG